MDKNHLHIKNENYNSVITIILIIILIIVRIFINNYEKQNIVIAWVNFISMFYILWRIYYQINSSLFSRKEKNILFKKQYKNFKQFSILFFIILLLIMIVYSFFLVVCKDFYEIGACINDIVSLCALLFSIEDEKVITKITEHYRYR